MAIPYLRTSFSVEAYFEKIDQSIKTIEAKIKEKPEQSDSYFHVENKDSLWPIMTSLHDARYEDCISNSTKQELLTKAIEKIEDLFATQKKKFPVWHCTHRQLTNVDKFYENRPIEQFEGDRVVVGCGYNYVYQFDAGPKQCAGHDPKKELLIDATFGNQPDVVAFYQCPGLWKKIKPESINEIYFEGLNVPLEEESLNQMKRVLKAGGRLKILVDSTKPELSKLGFAKHEIEEETIHTIGQIKKWTVLHLYK